MASLFSFIFCGLLPDSKNDIATEFSFTMSLEKRIRLIEQCASVIARVNSLRGLSSLLVHTIRVFQQSRCNLISNYINRDLLCHALWTLGHPNTGLVGSLISEQTLTPTTIQKVSDLESLLSSSIQYFTRFTEESYHRNLLVGKVPALNFDEFQRDFIRLFNDFILSSGSSPQKTLPPSRRSAFVSCNWLPIVRALDEANASAGDNSADESYVAVFAQERGLLPAPATRSTCFEELACFRDCLMRVQQQAARSQMKLPADVIQHPLFRDFWIEVLGPASFSESMDDFFDKLQLYLRQTLLILEEDATSLLGPFRWFMMNNCKAIDRVTPIDVAKVTRSLPRGDARLDDYIRALGLQRQKTLHLTPLLEEASLQSIFWGPDQRDHLTALLSRPGLGIVSGTEASGKSLRVLAIVDGLKAANPDVDYLWIDLDRVTSESAALSRVCSQLFLYNCNTVQDLGVSLKKLFSSLRAGSVIVFDNISFGSLSYKEAAEVDAYQNLLSNLLKITLTFEESLTFVTVVRAQDEANMVAIGYKDIVRIEEPNYEAAMGVAAWLQQQSPVTSFYEVDPQAVVTASTSSIGLMTFLTRHLSLRATRRVALQVLKTFEAAGESADVLQTRQESYRFTAEMIFEEMTDDQRLLACCLYPFISHFDEGLTYAMSQDAFQGDTVRWRLAWEGLLAVGWVVNRDELGFCVSKIGSSIYPTCNHISEQRLFDNYIIYWVQEMARLNDLANKNRTDADSILEQFWPHTHHLKRVIMAILSRKLVPDAATEADTSYAIEFSISKDTPQSPSFILVKDISMHAMDVVMEILVGHCTTFMKQYMMYKASMAVLINIRDRCVASAQHEQLLLCLIDLMKVLTTGPNPSGGLVEVDTSLFSLSPKMAPLAWWVFGDLQLAAKCSSEACRASYEESSVAFKEIGDLAGMTAVMKHAARALHRSTGHAAGTNGKGPASGHI